LLTSLLQELHDQGVLPGRGKEVEQSHSVPVEAAS
jgi:hypothetical protein